MHKFLRLFPARILAGAAVGLLALASGCSYSHGAEPAPTPSPCSDPAQATYAAAISPIFDAHCRECHGAKVYQTLGGGNDYSDYKGIKHQSASLITSCIEHQPGYNYMPKGKDQLSACDIARIKAWIAAGQLDN